MRCLYCLIEPALEDSVFPTGNWEWEGIHLSNLTLMESEWERGSHRPETNCQSSEKHNKAGWTLAMHYWRCQFVTRGRGERKEMRLFCFTSTLRSTCVDPYNESWASCPRVGGSVSTREDDVHAINSLSLSLPHSSQSLSLPVQTAFAYV